MGRRWWFVAGGQGHGGACVLVDNLGAICDNVALSQEMVSEWRDLFEPLWLALHKTEEHLARGEVFGRPLYIRGSRFSRNVVKCATVTFSSTTLRMFQSGMRCLWSSDAFGDSRCFCLRHGGCPGIPACSEAMPALQRGALAHSFWSRGTVAEVARIPERSTFRRSGTHSARELAQVSALLAVKSDGRWRLRESLIHLGGTEEWGLDTGFKEVPWSLLRRSRWKHFRKGMGR